jgi:hypothetical protein
MMLGGNLIGRQIQRHGVSAAYDTPGSSSVLAPAGSLPRARRSMASSTPSILNRRLRW